MESNHWFKGKAKAVKGRVNHSIQKAKESFSPSPFGRHRSLHHLITLKHSMKDIRITVLFSVQAPLGSAWR